MSQMLKCPNPSCPYAFDPSQVPTGVVLSCPRCGMQFTLGAPAAAPPPPAPPVDPAFEAVGRAALVERDPGERLPPRGTNKAQVFILAGIASVLMAGTILTLVFLYLRRGEQGPGAATHMADFNVAIEPLPAGWVRDEETRVTLGVPFLLCYRKGMPEAYTAFGAGEPGKGRAPRPADMRKELYGVFNKKLFDPTSLKEEEPTEKSWLGKSIAPSHAVQFRIQSPDGLIWRGEGYSVAHKGVAYYWVGWTGENDYDAMKDEFASIRKRFKLLDLRKDWKESRSNLTDFKGDTVPYTVTDAEELWKEVPGADLAELKKIEPDLDKRLTIRLTPPRDRKARPEEAELSVYVLAGAGGEPGQTAKEFAQELETKRIKEANSDFAAPTFKELADPPQGDPVPDDAPKGAPATRLLSDVKESASANRLIVVSGIKCGDKTVVVYCWCEAKSRGTFESKFVQIASSLRER